MTVIDITTNYLDFFSAKKDIENYLINNKELETEFTLEEFIEFIQQDIYTYKHGKVIYIFSFYKNTDTQYVFIINKQHIKTNDELINTLEKINYNFDTLPVKTPLQLVQENLVDFPYFYYDKKIMIIN